MENAPARKLVKIGKLPGRIVEVQYEGDVEMNIRDALDASGLGVVDGYEIRVNGELTDLNYVLKPGDCVLFTQMITGM